VIFDAHNFVNQDDVTKLRAFCHDMSWKCYEEGDIVGSEASTVIIYDLEELHFEAFTRAINNLIIITTNSGRGSGSLRRALNKIRQGEHRDEECRDNCAANRILFKSQLYECPFVENGEGTTSLLDQAKVRNIQDSTNDSTSFFYCRNSKKW